MDGNRKYYAKRSKSEKDVNPMISLMQNLRNNKNEQRKKRETDKPRNSLLTIENKLMVARGEMGGGMAEIGDRE